MQPIEGTTTKAGYVEVLHILKFIGLILSWIDDRTRGKSWSINAAAKA
jgi:hypothetical protein